MRKQDRMYLQFCCCCCCDGDGKEVIPGPLLTAQRYGVVALNGAATADLYLVADLLVIGVDFVTEAGGAIDGDIVMARGNRILPLCDGVTLTGLSMGELNHHIGSPVVKTESEGGIKGCIGLSHLFLLKGIPHRQDCTICPWSQQQHQQGEPDSGCFDHSD